ncbi:MAG: phage scaffolding protein [Clostridia bacterium]|nr:phage scaffolding protein [Clostridia bacterium]
MAYEFLQKLFGTTKDGEQPKSMTYEELVAAIGADSSISVVNLKDGGYVSKDKFDAKETELKGVQTQLATANETIKGFKDQDVDGIKQKVSEWETKYNTDTQALKDQLAQQARAHAEEMFLSGYKFTSKAARNGVLAELRSKNFTVENGTLLGGKEFIDSLMAQDDYGNY